MSSTPVVSILVRTQDGYAPFDFLVDTGADCSMMPASIAETELGLDLRRADDDVFFGIEGGGVHVFRGAIDVKIGSHPLRIRCVFTPHEHCPLILGRLDVFRHFSITFDNRNRLIRFTNIGSAGRSAR